ncbi:MAG: transcriptional regulator [Mesorhizobium sp.]|uniref:MucR family transcriptional regulator n=1 Tax=unclassified Mesorhizobium TaxID=325217 RepID=UPI000FCC0702|nr:MULTISPECIES: MucR family transcriptional regulator [unclassified Mesorhizobium]RUV13563.1 transcriptional regulator [Mesorhizobium sp. M1A.F.Ca.IN.022.04.1.1]RUV63519.1 transcriptional regulator [Mesorhizobium sp. M1A.F.Ca.IN.022.02.1.1]RWG27387.1 MAG: transcriptional regulator [Mesorhizobium sp.]RWH26994.1 MAG: transcriptional regulator [Mesorhizobium sp.]TIM35985.1 MAG: transcriptional regulator [Mesorhizobium sp.]
MPDFTRLTADIVSAYVSNNAVPAAQLPALIASVDATVRGLGGEVKAEAPAPVPAVNPRKSIFPDHIICLEDGKKFKSLKRHLATDYGLTPEAYREKWGLPADYPMVAPNYSQKRSALAKASGLGRGGHVRTHIRHAVQ